MYQRVKLYAQDGSKRRINCYFSCPKALKNFVKILDSLDHCTMEWDLFDEEDIPLFNYPLIPGNMTGFKIAYKSLYPDLAI